MLIDTGNELSDPITGKRVLVAGLDKIGALLPPDIKFIIKNAENITDAFEKLSKSKSVNCSGLSLTILWAGRMI